MNKLNSFKIVISFLLLSFFIFFAINSNPGWLKYPDSQFYLALARSWGDGKFVLDDGTGAFVRPVAYLLYGIAYKLGGFDGIHLFITSSIFLAISYFIFSTKSIFIALTCFALIVSKPFIVYSNSILLQSLGLCFVFVGFAISMKGFRPFSAASFYLNLILIIGIFVHGGILFLWLSYLVTLVAHQFRRYGDNSLLNIRKFIFYAFGYFLVLIVVLLLMEIYFQERVFKSFFGESRFTNNPHLYFFGKFYYVYIENIFNAMSYFGLSLISLWIFSFLLGIYSFFKGGIVNFWSLWLFLYLLIFEILTFIKILKRDPTSSEYLRTYFMSFPLLIISAYSGLSSLIVIVKKYGLNSKVFLYSIFLIPGVIFIFLAVPNLKSRFDKAPYFYSKEALLNIALIPSKASVLLAPSNIYIHRRFFSDSDFLGSRAVYFYDFCRNSDFVNLLNEFEYVYIVKEKSMIDNRMNGKLVEAGGDCIPSSSHSKILVAKGFKIIFEDRIGVIYGVNKDGGFKYEVKR